MKIINCGSGIHSREVKGVEKLQSLPANWVAYTNVDLICGPHKTCEIDVILITPDRIMMIDLKDWRGTITSQNGRWEQNGKDVCRSPVNKMLQNVRESFPSFSAHFKKYAKGRSRFVPKIQGFVVMTGSGDISGIHDTEKSQVFQIDDFVARVEKQVDRIKTFGTVKYFSDTMPLNKGNWLHIAKSFFNESNGLVQPGKKLYGNFASDSDRWTFQHPDEVYSEFDVKDKNSTSTLGTLRLWDFSQADTRFQNEDGRKEIAGRERDVFAYVKGKSLQAETALLTPQTSDPNLGVNYWEVFDRRENLLRFRDFDAQETSKLTPGEKVELSRQILSQLSQLHSIDVSHQDIGPHSVWMEKPSNVRLSHLMAAKIPDVKSLGGKRYQFLATTKVPEDVFGLGNNAPKSRDIYLVAHLIHKLLFGSKPSSKSQDEPGEWSSSVDVEQEYGRLHHWFKTALSLEPNDRFQTASEALHQFNKSTEERPTQQEVIEGLESFKRFNSSRALLREFPETRIIIDDNRVTIWKSEVDNFTYLMKLWSAENWESSPKEKAKILDFLQKAENIRRLNLPGIAKICEVHWTTDAIVLAQEFSNGKPLSSEQHLFEGKPDLTVGFLLKLTEIVENLHDNKFGHGDLKPENILVSQDSDSSLEITLIDIPDFSSVADGDRQNTRYSPYSGGTLERDRYAVTEIARELIGSASDELDRFSEVLAAVDQCQSSEPKNGTLEPFLRALDGFQNPEPLDMEEIITIGNQFLPTDAFESDHGMYHLRRHPSRNEFYMRGLCEELRFICDADGKVQKAFRNPIDQSRISRLGSHELINFKGIIQIKAASAPNYEDLYLFLEGTNFTDIWGGAQKEANDTDKGEDEVYTNEIDNADSDLSYDALIEASELDPDVASIPDFEIETLWRALVDAEDELLTIAVAVGDSSFREDIKRHVVEIDIQAGNFDFSEKDSVGIERQDRKGNWRRIGELDIKKSSGDNIFIIAHISDPAFMRSDLLYSDQRLKFTSHFEEQSRRRRKSAIERIMARHTAIPNLIDAFEPTQDGAENNVTSTSTDLDFSNYGLNEPQSKALIKVLSDRPLGLVQGPPGTGKTKFISALAHLALKSGLVSNVLLASQSHEAVNNATESLLKLFRDEGEVPSLLRVGHESSVSPSLAQFHAKKIEKLYKDRFQAELRMRLQNASRTLSISSEILDKIITMEEIVRPVVYKIRTLDTAKDEKPSQSTINLLEKSYETLGIDFTVDQLLDSGISLSELLFKLSLKINASFPFDEKATEDALWRFRQLADIAHDFIATESGAQRSFEPFLAGTRKIVSGTCVGLGRPSLGLTSTNFDLVIVDEAARCTASELAVPLQSARWVVLVGDHLQLEPINRPGIVKQVQRQTGLPISEIMRSDFERLFSGNNENLIGSTLDTQYRMLPPIGRIVSKVFYGGSLKHGRQNSNIPISAIPPVLAMPITWLTSDALGRSGFDSRPKRSNSFVNKSEADAILSLLQSMDGSSEFIEHLTKKNKFEKHIGIICMYADQRDLVSRKIRSSQLSETIKNSIKVGTVDSYQGKENTIVIVSLVRNNSLEPYQIRQGFLSKPNRINVAMSRAMDRLVIVGAKMGWPADSPLQKLSREVDREAEAGFAKVISINDIEAEFPKGEGI